LGVGRGWGEGPEKSSFKNAGKQSKMGKRKKKKVNNSSLLILKLSTSKVSFFLES